MTDAEHRAMERALALALNGWGRVAPNPLVGAVLLRGDEVVGEGWHAEFGGPHAEIAALERCTDPAGTTCVVTLEPCAHHGKTRPCVEALVEARVARVVAAVRDPDPRACGGLDRLAAAGVAVETGVLADRAAAQNAAFLWSTVRSGQPFVAVKLATSLDGFIADHGGQSQWLSGPEALEWAHWLRAGFDAIAVGRVTALADDPLLTVRGAVTPRVPPVRVVFGGRGPLPPTLRCFAQDGSTPAVAVVHPDAHARRLRKLEPAGVEVIRASTGSEAVAALRRRGIRSLLVEGGGRLAAGLLTEGLVDRVYRITSPRFLGKGTAAFSPLPAIGLGQAPRWVVTERRTLGADSLLVVDRSLCSPGS